MVNKNRLYWTLQIGGWVAYAAFQILFSILAAGAEVGTPRMLFFVLEALLCLLITHYYRNYINEKKWLLMGLARLIPNVIAAVLLMGIVTYFLRIPFSIALGTFIPENAFAPERMINGIFFYAFFFFLWSVLHFTYNYFERYNKTLQLEASIKEIELSNLKSQLNPHFMFNALNSIRALVDENPGKAKQAINQLSSLLRNSLVSEKRSLTSFDDELKLVRDYLGLESIRFEERLKTEFDVDPESKDFMVPPLMIQTLVENGIKHGISKLTEGGLVQIKTKVDGDHLKIYIRNSGKLVVNGHKKDTGGGLGLENTKQRLKLIYGDEASFRILSENDNFVLTEIIIPHLY
ncbi:MAG TPA: histidine kinase [Cyclobacteriaceae bacterium]|nr:histidine kinase [Cyclobacteriaceae bacterium]